MTPRRKTILWVCSGSLIAAIITLVLFPPATVLATLLGGAGGFVARKLPSFIREGIQFLRELKSEPCNIVIPCDHDGTTKSSEKDNTMSAAPEEKEALLAKKVTLEESIPALASAHQRHVRTFSGILLAGFLLSLGLAAAGVYWLSMLAIVVMFFMLQNVSTRSPERALLDARKDIRQIRERLYALGALPEAEQAEMETAIETRARARAQEWNGFACLCFLFLAALFGYIVVVSWGSGERFIGLAATSVVFLCGGFFFGWRTVKRMRTTVRR